MGGRREGGREEGGREGGGREGGREKRITSKYVCMCVQVWVEDLVLGPNTQYTTQTHAHTCTHTHAHTHMHTHTHSYMYVYLPEHYQVHWFFADVIKLI